MTKNRPNPERAQRLKLARQRLFPSATAAAQHHGWTVSTYLGHENGSRGIGIDDLRAYGAAFRCDWVALATGEPGATA